MAAVAQPLTASRFSLTVDGVEIASFSELQGISTQVDVVDFVESTADGIVIKKVAGNRKPPQVVLKRGKNASMELWAWHEAVMYGKMDLARKSCSLVMYDVDGKPVARYYMENAWPAKLEVGGMRAGSSEVLTESVTIVCEHLQRVAA